MADARPAFRVVAPTWEFDEERSKSGSLSMNHWAPRYKCRVHVSPTTSLNVDGFITETSLNLLKKSLDRVVSAWRRRDEGPSLGVRRRRNPGHGRPAG